MVECDLRDSTGRRTALAFIAPGLLACAFVYFRSSSSGWDRLFTATVTGFLVEMAVTIGLTLAGAVASMLVGDQREDLTQPRNMIAGMLLATFVWMWWQSSRDTLIDEIASCVENALLDDPSTKPTRAIHFCYQSPNDYGSTDRE
jgi:hypothetical protein